MKSALIALLLGLATAALAACSPLSARAVYSGARGVMRISTERWMSLVFLLEKKYWTTGMSCNTGTPSRVLAVDLSLKPLKTSVSPRFITTLALAVVSAIEAICASTCSVSAVESASLLI